MFAMTKIIVIFTQKMIKFLLLFFMKDRFLDEGQEKITD